MVGYGLLEEEQGTRSEEGETLSEGKSFGLGSETGSWDASRPEHSDVKAKKDPAGGGSFKKEETGIHP
jgi:hypothetical protein